MSRQSENSYEKMVSTGSTWRDKLTDNHTFENWQLHKHQIRTTMSTSMPLHRVEVESNGRTVDSNVESSGRLKKVTYDGRDSLPGRSDSSSKLGPMKERRVKKRVLYTLLGVIGLVGIAVPVIVVMLLQKLDSKAPEVKVGTVDLELSVQNMQFSEALADPESEDYRNFTVQFCQEMETFYRRSSIGDKYEGCLVQELRQGSVIVIFTLVFTSEYLPIDTAVRKVFTDNATPTQSGSLSVTVGIYIIVDSSIVVGQVMVIGNDENPTPRIGHGHSCKVTSACRTYQAVCDNEKCGCVSSRHYSSSSDSCVLIPTTTTSTSTEPATTSTSTSDTTSTKHTLPNSTIVSVAFSTSSTQSVTSTPSVTSTASTPSTFLSTTVSSTLTPPLSSLSSTSSTSSSTTASRTPTLSVSTSLSTNTSPTLTPSVSTSTSATTCPTPLTSSSAIASPTSTKSASSTTSTSSAFSSSTASSAYTPSMSSTNRMPLTSSSSAARPTFSPLVSSTISKRSTSSSTTASPMSTHLLSSSSRVTPISSPKMYSWTSTTSAFPSTSTLAPSSSTAASTTSITSATSPSSPTTSTATISSTTAQLTSTSTSTHSAATISTSTPAASNSTMSSTSMSTSSAATTLSTLLSTQFTPESSSMPLPSLEVIPTIIYLSPQNRRLKIRTTGEIVYQVDNATDWVIVTITKTTPDSDTPIFICNLTIINGTSGGASYGDNTDHIKIDLFGINFSANFNLTVRFNPVLCSDGGRYHCSVTLPASSFGTFEVSEDIEAHKMRVVQLNVPDELREGMWGLNIGCSATLGADETLSFIRKHPWESEFRNLERYIAVSRNESVDEDFPCIKNSTYYFDIYLGDWNTTELRCIINTDTDEVVLSAIETFRVVPRAVCDGIAALQNVPHPYNCKLYVTCTANETFPWGSWGYVHRSSCPGDECWLPGNQCRTTTAVSTIQN